MKVRILPDEERNFLIGASVAEEERVEMLLFLVQNIDVFAWNPYEVPRVDLEFIVHKLEVPSVDATYGHPRMSFLDAFQGYHQIALAAKD